MKCPDVFCGDEAVVPLVVEVVEAPIQAPVHVVEEVVGLEVESEPTFVQEMHSEFVEEGLDGLQNMHVSLGSMGVRDEVQEINDVVEVIFFACITDDFILHTPHRYVFVYIFMCFGKRTMFRDVVVILFISSHFQTRCARHL